MSNKIRIQTIIELGASDVTSTDFKKIAKLETVESAFSHKYFPLERLSFFQNTASSEFIPIHLFPRGQYFVSNSNHIRL